MLSIGKMKAIVIFCFTGIQDCGRPSLQDKHGLRNLWPASLLFCRRPCFENRSQRSFPVPVHQRKQW